MTVLGQKLATSQDFRCNNSSIGRVVYTVRPIVHHFLPPTVAGRYRYYPGEAGCDDTNPNGAPESFNWIRKTSRRAINSTLWSESSTRHGSRFSLLAVIGQSKWWPIPSTVHSTLRLYCQRAIGQIMPYPPKHTSSTRVRY